MKTGHDVPNGQGGILVIKRPWPRDDPHDLGRPRPLSRSRYYPDELGGKLYLAGDGSVRDKETGYFTHHGPHRRRAQRVRAPTGHDGSRVGAGGEPELVAEAAVVGRPDDLTGEAMCAFVVLKRARPTGDEAQKIAKELRDWVGKEIGPIAKPKDIRFGDNLPKTRSRQDHAPPAALDREGRGDHAGHLDAREPGDPRAAEAGSVAGSAIPPRPGALRRGFRRTTGASPSFSASRSRFGYASRQSCSRVTQVEVAERAPGRDIRQRHGFYRGTTCARQARVTARQRLQLILRRDGDRSIRRFAGGSVPPPRRRRSPPQQLAHAVGQRFPVS